MIGYSALLAQTNVRQGCESDESLTANDSKYGSNRLIDLAPPGRSRLPSMYAPSSLWSWRSSSGFKAPDTPAPVRDIAILDDPDAD